VTGLFLDPVQRPAQLSQRDDLLFLFFTQDIRYGGEAKLAMVNVRAPLLVGFQTGITWPVLRWPHMAALGWPRGAIALLFLASAETILWI
jgi:hypothetical protein